MVLVTMRPLAGLLHCCHCAQPLLLVEPDPLILHLDPLFPRECGVAVSNLFVGFEVALLCGNTVLRCSPFANPCAAFETSGARAPTCMKSIIVVSSTGSEEKG